MEGNTYQCDWEKKRGKFTIWVVSNPDTKGVGSSFSEAEDDLYEQICLAYGDGEALVEYVRELPDSVFPREYATPFFYCLSPSIWIPISSDLNELYDKGYCEACGYGVGQRNSVPIVVEEFPSQGDLLMLVKGSFVKGSTLHVVVVSERLSDQLSLESNFTLREVTSIVKSRKKYFEVIPKLECQLIGGVAVNKMEEKMGEFWGWKCDECGNSGSHYYAGSHLSYVVPRTSIKNQDIFIVNEHLAVKGALWKQAAESLKLKGISASQLGFAAEENIKPNPTPKFHYSKKSE